MPKEEGEQQKESWEDAITRMAGGDNCTGCNTIQHLNSKGYCSACEGSQGLVPA